MLIQAVIVAFKSTKFTMGIYLTIAPMVKKMLRIRELIVEHRILQTLQKALHKEIVNLSSEELLQIRKEIEYLRKEIDAIKSYMEDSGIFDNKV